MNNLFEIFLNSRKWAIKLNQRFDWQDFIIKISHQLKKLILLSLSFKIYPEDVLNSTHVEGKILYSAPIEGSRNCAMKQLEKAHICERDVTQLKINLLNPIYYYVKDCEITQILEIVVIDFGYPTFDFCIFMTNTLKLRRLFSMLIGLHLCSNNLSVRGNSELTCDLTGALNSGWKLQLIGNRW